MFIDFSFLLLCNISVFKEHKFGSFVFIDKSNKRAKKGKLMNANNDLIARARTFSFCYLCDANEL